MRTLEQTQAAARAVPLDATTPVEWALTAFCGRPGGFALDWTAAPPANNRFTILGCDPVETVCVEPSRATDAIARWAARVEAVSCSGAWRPLSAVPFCGGWVGYIAYEAGFALDRIGVAPRTGRLLPDLRFSLYDTVAVYAHARRQWYVAGVEWPDRPPLADRLAQTADWIACCTPPTPMDTQRAISDPPVSNLSRSDYLAAVALAKEYIAAGDVYQVNLAQRFSATVGVSPLELYRRLRRVNPAPYGAFLASGDRAVLSASPELFLDVRGDRVVTRPIKGTRPRSGDPTGDAARRDALEASEKDRAELNMIVDLLRNDLGRVCRFGSVRVTSPGTIEEHPTVFHRVATVTGRLAPPYTWVDLLRATFPGGSITGAPKIRAMQIIHEIEPTPRDVYCGAIGYVGLDGTVSLNIAIRTMVMRGSQVYLYAGGGIVADSDPQDEYEETLAKAAGMMRALGHEISSEY